MPISWNPQEQFEGGLIRDVDATLTRLAVEDDIYQNGTPSIGLVGELTLDGGDKVRVVWSLGSPREWEIWDDKGPVNPGENGKTVGTKAESVKGHTGAGKSSNAGMLMKEILAAGFPANKFGESVTALEGLYAHWIRKPQVKHDGIVQTDDREKTVLVPEVIHKHGMPWEASMRKKGPGAGVPAGKTNAAAAGAGASAATSTNDLENETALTVATAVLPLIFASKSGSVVPKTNWNMLILGAMGKTAEYTALPKDSPDKQAVSRILKHPEFLGANGIEVQTDGSMKVPAPPAQA